MCEDDPIKTATHCYKTLGDGKKFFLELRMVLKGVGTFLMDDVGKYGFLIWNLISHEQINITE